MRRPTRSDVRAAFADNFLGFQYHSTEYFAEHLADASRVFGGDLAEMLVLAIIGQVALHAMLRENEDTSIVPRPIPESATIAASRLAEVTGIPRETVRRKLDKLRARGFIEATRQGWRLQGDGVHLRETFADLESRQVDRLARLYCALDAIVEKKSPAGAGPRSNR